ncbi:MAG: hypothetical protein ABIN80_03330 [Dyadobacter sp.]|uniref:hypothetical protein n=1 Tax=Dyadobacter sp. TaxID=1914288 RepID=UPI0032661F19
MTLKTFEIGAGSYIGFGKIRPYLGFHYSGVFGNYRSTFIGAQGGISYNRLINIEIGHFANFYSVFSETGFFRASRISIHYMLNLSKLFKRG